MLEAIKNRKSVRQYEAQGIDETLFQKVRDCVNTAKVLYNDIGLRIEVVQDGTKIHQVMNGFLGSYGKVKSPHYLVVISETKEGYHENVGYTMEEIVLGMTALGLGTCWIGGFFDRELIKRVISMAAGEKAVVIIAFGYEKRGMWGEAVRNFAGFAKRKMIEEIAFHQELGKNINEFLEQNPLWQEILACVRLAPSAVNLQPWRMIFKEDRIDLYAKSNISVKSSEDTKMHRIDLGIAMKHLEIACQAYDIPGVFKRQEHDLIQGHEYISSFKLLKR